MCSLKLPNFCLLVQPGMQQAVFVDLAVFEGVGRFAVEQHDRAGRRLGASRGAAAIDLFEARRNRERPCVPTRDDAVLDLAGGIACVKTSSPSFNSPSVLYVFSLSQPSPGNPPT